MELGQRIFYLARQKAMFLKQVAKDDNFKIIELAIMGVAGHHPGISQEEIRDIVQFDEASVARSLKDLEAKKLITREVNLENKRLKKVRLTEAGTKCTKHFNEILSFWDNELLEDLSLEERQEIEELLDKAALNSEKLRVDNMLTKWRGRKNNE